MDIVLVVFGLLLVGEHGSAWRMDSHVLGLSPQVEGERRAA